MVVRGRRSEDERPSRRRHMVSSQLIKLVLIFVSALLIGRNHVSNRPVAHRLRASRCRSSGITSRTVEVRIAPGSLQFLVSSPRSRHPA